MLQNLQNNYQLSSKYGYHIMCSWFLDGCHVSFSVLIKPCTPNILLYMWGNKQHSNHGSHRQSFYLLLVILSPIWIYSEWGVDALA